LILPALAHAQNNQGNGGPRINPGVPNGTYSFTESGFYTGGVFAAAAGRETFFANGTTTGVVTFSIGGTVYSGVTLAGTFTVNAGGSVSQTVYQTSPPGQTLHFINYPTPDGNTLTNVQTDPGSTVSGFATRGRSSYRHTLNRFLPS
jgi:hypothetical protein